MVQANTLTRQTMNIFATSRFNLHRLGLPMVASVALFLAACTTPPPPAPKPAPAPVPPAPIVKAPPVELPTYISEAVTPRDYRRDAASHLYEKNMRRVFQGKMPPLLYAVGVLQVEVDGKGHVTSTSWMRPPLHAPEVMAEIERTVRLAAPYPAPVRMGRVTYTDTWLWHKSGLFQLDTLTEGQM